MVKQDIYVNEEDEVQKKKNQRGSTFNGLTANEWTINSKSVWSDIKAPKKTDFYDNGEIIPLDLCDKIISIYSKEEDVILDPFMGLGNVIVSGIKSNRYCFGFEINKKYYEKAERNISSSLNLLVNGSYEIQNGDALELIDNVKDDSVQLVLTSPSYPFGVSFEEKDFSLMNEFAYEKNMEDLLFKIHKKVSPGGYCVFVVKDYRDIKNERPYVDFHSQISSIGKKAGFLLQDITIFDLNDQRGLILLGYPSRFYSNINHCYIIIFRKEK
ncbi:MAG: TRM11 family SAM-dependent methyltransferase [Bacilli bacterium]|nr:hypothetical protein [Erysipelotrichaceae bacterium]MDY2746062.1 DNA methyltransferase [Bacilli bacterium]MDY3890249.1 DNA methyltransferase [Bacilli bacterium]